MRLKGAGLRAGPQHKKPVGVVPAASSGLPQISPTAVPMQHLAAVPNVAQSLMLQQLAQLSPQQQQQYVLAAQRAAQQQALLTGHAPGFAIGQQSAPQHSAAISGATPSPAAFLSAATAVVHFPSQRSGMRLVCFSSRSPASPMMTSDLLQPVASSYYRILQLNTYCMLLQMGRQEAMLRFSDEKEAALPL